MPQTFSTINIQNQLPETFIRTFAQLFKCGD